MKRTKFSPFEVGFIIAVLMAVSYVAYMFGRPHDLNSIPSETQRAPTSTERTPSDKPRSQNFLNNEDVQVGSQNTSPKRNKKTNPFLASLRHSKACLERLDCDYPSNDPREYSLSIYTELEETLTKNTPYLLKHWPRLDSAIKAEVVDLISTESGHVKKAVLNLLNSLPKEEALPYVDTVVNQVLNFHDAKLIPDALKFLNSAKNNQNQNYITQEIAQALQYGSPHVSEAISQNIKNFLNETTLGKYKQTALGLPKNSREKDLLDSYIREYEMQKIGG